MSEIVDPLILDLVEWVAKAPRPYADVMEAWRTSCPRLTVWEDAVDDGYLVRERVAGQSVLVTVTPQGLQFLATMGACRQRQRSGCLAVAVVASALIAQAWEAKRLFGGHQQLVPRQKPAPVRCGRSGARSISCMAGVSLAPLSSRPCAHAQA